MNENLPPWGEGNISSNRDQVEYTLTGCVYRYNDASALPIKSSKGIQQSQRLVDMGQRRI